MHPCGLRSYLRPSASLSFYSDNVRMSTTWQCYWALFSFLLTTTMAFSAAGAREQGRSNSLGQDILARIQHLDLSDNITDRSRKSVAHGGYCEVYTGRLHRGKKERVHVAIKRLRFHTGEEKVMKARPSLLSSGEVASSQGLPSNSRRKSTCGQSCPIQTSCRC